jgi:hypothetical protein
MSRGLVCFRGISSRARTRTASLGETGQSTPRGTAQRLAVNETSKPDTATNVTQHYVYM